MRATLGCMILLLAGCSGGQPAEAPRDGKQAAGTQSPAQPRTGALVGLWEGGQASPRNQLCMRKGAGDASEFGLVVWGGNLHSCSGKGIATREGATLTLAMAGDSACAIEARMEGEAIVLPDTLPEGCAYYCGARARMNGVRFDPAGSTPADAAKAKDLVGDPLCN